MIIGKGVVDGHVFKEPPDVLVKEAFDFLEVELRIYEYGANVGLNNVRKRLLDLISISRAPFIHAGKYLGRLLGICPIIASPFSLSLCFFDFSNIFSILMFNDGAIGSQVLVEAELDRQCRQKFV